MNFRLTALGLVLTLLCACDNTSSPQPESKAGTLQSAQVDGAIESISVGDSIELSAGYTSMGSVDSSQVKYTWKLSGADSVYKTLSDSGIANLIPKEPGKYTLNLEISYAGKTVSTLVVFIVTQKIIYVDSSRTAQLETFREKLPGSYIGTVTTPWLPPYEIAMVFRADGGYSAYTTDTTSTPALYYGMDADSPEKTWVLNDVRADGKGLGKINFVFDNGSVNQGAIESLVFDNTLSKLQFSLSKGEYGPLKFTLSRINPEDLPVLPPDAGVPVPYIPLVY